MFNKIGSVLFVVVLLAVGVIYDGRFTKKSVDVTPTTNTSVVSSVVDKIMPSQDESLNRVLSKQVVNVAVMNPSKPFFYMEGSRAKGFNVDFMKLLFSQNEFGSNISINTDQQVDTYEAVPKQLLSNKNVDIAIDGLTFNNDDLNGVVYSIPYVKDFGYSLITLKGTSMNSASDTVGTKIGVLKGDPDALAFTQNTFPQAKIVELSDKADSNGKWIIGHIKSGTVDAVVYDYPFAVAEVNDTDLQFSITKIEGSDIKYTIGVRKEDKALLVAINSAIRKSIEDSSYPDMIKKYFMSTNVASVRRVSASETTYMVVVGDTLSNIAQKLLGDKMKYTEIQSRNNLANPNFISVGQKLVIPNNN